jgi:hypothetical protein
MRCPDLAISLSFEYAAVSMNAEGSLSDSFNFLLWRLGGTSIPRMCWLCRLMIELAAAAGRSGHAVASEGSPRRASQGVHISGQDAPGITIAPMAFFEMCHRCQGATATDTPRRGMRRRH